MRGYGKSDYLFDKIYIEEQAFDLALLLDELMIEKVHLIGLSMGGEIIMEFYRLFPSRVKSLVICASIPKAESEISYQSRIELANKIQNIGMKDYTDQDIHKYLSKSAIDEQTEIYNHLYNRMVNTKTEGAVASHKGRAERRDIFPYLSKINVPTLVISGEKDFFFHVTDIKNVADQIPNSIFKVISNVGHLPNMEKPMEFNSILINFLSINKR